MFLDARTVEEGARIDSEVCIVGGGAAGITLARELSASGVRVVVLESGGRELDLESVRLATGELSGIPYFPLESARLRYFGGSTNHWGGLCRPFSEADFAAPDWLPGGWPITHADVEPYYARSAEICGLPAPDWSVDRWRRDSPHTPVELEDPFVNRVALQVPSARRSFAVTYGDELERSEAVTVVLYANAMEIETDDDALQATGVRVATTTGRGFTVAAGIVVLAAGGIDNPRLLLASRSRVQAGLGNAHDQVGRYFMEHPRFEAAIIATADAFPEGFYTPHNAGGVSIQGYLAKSEAAQLAGGLIDVQLRLRANYERAYDEADDSRALGSARNLARIARGQIPDDLAGDVVDILDDLGRWRGLTIAGGPVPVPDPAAIDAFLSGTSLERRALLSEMVGHLGVFGMDALQGPPFESITVLTRLAQVPNPDSRITLADEVDILGMPLPHLHWAMTQTDRDATLVVLERLGTAIGQAGLGRLRILLDEQGSDWPADIAGGHHLMGTTRMHADPRQGVVDGDCRVHGVENLYVAGSSVFTYGGSGTPTLTLVALTLRLADHLRQRLAA